MRQCTMYRAHLRPCLQLALCEGPASMHVHAITTAELIHFGRIPNTSGVTHASALSAFCGRQHMWVTSQATVKLPGFALQGGQDK